MTPALTAWAFDPPIVVSLALPASLYLEGVRRVVRARGLDRVLRWRTIAFLSGIAVLYVALQSPLDTYADVRVSVHMVQHLLLTMVAAPLLALGMPVTLALRAATPDTRRRRLVPLLRNRVFLFATSPRVAWGLFAVVLWTTHFSPLYDAALRSNSVHALEHVLYVVAAVLFWSPVVGAEAGRSKMAHPTRLLYLFLAMPQMTFLGVAMWSTDHVLYPTYLASLGLSAALSDQRLAGTIMGTAGMFVVVPAMGVVLLDWFRHEELEAVRVDARLARARAGGAEASR